MPGKPVFNINFNVTPPAKGAAVLPTDFQLPEPSFSGLDTAVGKANVNNPGLLLSAVEVEVPTDFQLPDPSHDGLVTAMGEANAHTGVPDFHSAVEVLTDLDLPDPSLEGLVTAMGKANAHTGVPDFLSVVLNGLANGTDGGELIL